MAKQSVPVSVLQSWFQEYHSIRSFTHTCMALTGVMFLASYPIQHSIDALPLARALRWGSLIPGYLARSKFRRIELLEYEFARCQVYEVENRVDRYVEALRGNVMKPEIVEAELVNPELPPALTPVDLRTVSFNHLMILGPTGFGKSTLAGYLLDNIQGDIVVIDPHATPRTWGDLPVLGMGRDYPAIRRFMEKSGQEMKERYERRMKGDERYDTLNVVIDEFPAVAKSTKPDEFKEWVQTLLCEARKVNIKLILMSQGKSVKTLGLEGQSELLENLTIVRGKSFAIAHAKSLKDDALIEWLRQQNRPATIDDEGLIIPDLSNYNPRLDRKPSSDLLRLLGTSQSLPNHFPVTSTSTSTNTPEVDVSPQEVALPGLTEVEVGAVVRAKQEGKSSTYIVENILGFKGRNFKKGRELLAQIEEFL